MKLLERGRGKPTLREAHNTDSRQQQSKAGMSGRDTMYSLVLFLVLTSASAVQKLNSINDLKQINFGHSVPKHSLVLLHWFANIIEIDNNDVIPLTFEPDRGDYNTHHYGNYERLLDPLPRGYRYYTLGNLNSRNNQGSNLELPSYVTQNLHTLMGNEERNRDRIIFRVTHNVAGQTIDQVYITQHYEADQRQGTRYDRAHTYRITTNLLREIREFSVGENQRNSLSELAEHFGRTTNNSQLRYLRSTWGDLACLALLLLIVIKEKHSSDQSNNKNPPSYKGENVVRKKPQTHFVVNIPEETQNHLVIGIPESMQNPLLQHTYQSVQMNLEVRTGRNGNTRIQWDNIPQHLLSQGAMVVLFQNNERKETSKIANRYGSYDTSVPLNPGLQVRLHKTSTRCCFWTTMGEEICRGSEFNNPRAQKPVHIRPYDASLQLFVKDGKACARLYVRKTFSEWRSDFRKSWVGFYSSAIKETNEYEWWQWQWATKFRRCTDLENPLDHVYEYHSSMAIAPGLQARFISRDGEDMAHTPTWE